MLSCGWCEAPATGEVVVEPARFGGRRGQRVLVKAERRAPACTTCRNRVKSYGLRPAPKRGVIEGQTTIDDMLGAA